MHNIATLKNKHMLTLTYLVLGTPQLNKSDHDDILCSKDVHRDINIHPTDNVKVSHITVSAMEETKQTTNLNEPLNGQDSSRLTLCSILTDDTI